MRKRPIGQILVERGEISETDLQAALAEQERSGRRLGEILIEQGRTSWLAISRAVAEQVLDFQSVEVEPEPAPVVEEREPVAMTPEAAALPPVPDPLPPPQFAEPPAAVPEPVRGGEHELVRAVAEQVVALPPPGEEQHVVELSPAHAPRDPDARLHQIETLLRERQRAFMELVSTAEMLRTRIARLEEMVEERDRELSRLRVVDAG